MRRCWLWFAAHFALCLYTLSQWWAESCVYEYHYLLLVWMLRDVLGVRILYWQTTASAAEPSTFDRFLKNWQARTHTHTLTHTSPQALHPLTLLCPSPSASSLCRMDMIALIYGGMWALAPRDCLASAPHLFYVSSALVLVSYASLLLRGCLYLTMTHLRERLSDSAFVLLRSVGKWLNGGAAFTGQLLRANDALVMSEMEGVTKTRYDAGHWDADDDTMCSICLEEYVDGVSELTRLTCGHSFHSQCIQRWLGVRNASWSTGRADCPLCRQSACA